MELQWDDVNKTAFAALQIKGRALFQPLYVDSSYSIDIWRQKWQMRGQLPHYQTGFLMSPQMHGGGIYCAVCPVPLWLAQVFKGFEMSNVAGFGR